jgi:hypothetical protein
MFVICRNNPSQPGDPDVCNTDHTGPARRPDGVPDVARAGDLRYNFLNLIDQPQIYSPLGYGPSAADPVGARIPLADGELELGAGELIAANANIYTSGLDRIAAATTDLIRLIEGDLPPEDYISGENVEAWIEELRENGSSAGMVGEVGQRAPVAPLRSVDVDPRARAAFDTIDGAWTGRTHDALSALPRPSDSFALRRWLIDADERIAASGALPPAGLSGRIAWDRMRSSGLDHPLWSAETMAASGVDPALTGSAPLDARSPLDPLGPEAIDTQALAALDAGRRGLDLDDGEIINPTLIGLARRYRAEGLDYEQILARIREEMFVSVTLHEVGHTLGLRHNFAASTDAWNYHPRYWELRDDGAMGPRHVDPETPEEIEGQIREFQYSSVMDYPGNHNGDWHGLGAYDRAAIRFGYGELVEVMTEPRAEPVLEGIPNETTIAIVAAWNDSTLFPSAVVGGPDGSIQDLHYTDYPRVANLGARAIVPWKRLTALSDPGVQDVPGFDTQLVLDEGVAGVAPAGAPAAPYRFCSDEYATGAMCARFDEGADAYEIIHYLMQDYWDRYLLDNFARDRYGFGFGDYAQSRYKRTFGPLERWVRNYALLYAVLDAAFDPATAAWMASDRGLGGWTLASADSFRFMTQVVLRPEPGRLSTVRRSDGLERLVPGAVGERSLELGAGAWYSSEWDTDSGYWWFQRWQRIGTYWDRMLAVQALTALSPYDFFGYDTASDPRTFALGYASLWGPQLEGFLGGLIADDLRALAPILDADDRLVYRDLLSDTGWPPAPFADSQVEHGAYWLVRYAAGLYAGAFLQDGFHMGWLDRARIYAEGSAEARTPSELTELVHWEDASTGLTWTAWRFPDAEGVETGAGARLLDHAVRLASVCSGEGPIDTEPDLSTFEREQLRPSACAELDRVADDIALQSRIVAVMSTNAPD